MMRASKPNGPLAVDTTTITISGSSNTLPANSDFYGHVGTVNGTYSGSQPVAVFLHSIDSLAVNGGSDGATGNIYNTRVRTVLGGGNQHGGFINFDSLLNLNQATGNTVNSFYQSGNFIAQASVNDGGTAGSASTTKGSLFSVGAYGKLLTGATGWHENSIMEGDLTAQTGTSYTYSYGYKVVLLSDNAVAPDIEQIAFLAGAQSGATPTVTMLLGVGGYAGINPLASTATLLGYSLPAGTGSYPQATITYGIDLFYFATTTAAWRGPNGTSKIDGSGNITGATVKTTPTTVSGLPSAATVGTGTRAFVTDATASTFASIVAGSGSTNVPVYSDGTNWRIG